MVNSVLMSGCFTHGLGAVIVVAMRDDDTVLLVKEYAVGLHHYELGLVKGRLEARRNRFARR